MRPEKKFWQQLKVKTPNVNWTRIESWSSPGVPDLFGVFWDSAAKCGVQFWVELKCNKLQKVIISPKQIAWHYAHTKLGGKSFIFTKISDPYACHGSIWIIPGDMIRELSDHGLGLLDQGKGHLVPEPWNEDEILKYLKMQPPV